MHLPSALVAVSALAASCIGHSMLSKPAPRGNIEWWGTCAAGAGCKGPCDAPKSNSTFSSIYVPKTYVKRGQELEVGWNRLNHPGGFVRLALVPFDQSDDWTAFNDNVLKYTCYETNCGPKDPSDDQFGHLNGAGDAPCSTKVTVPKNIPDNTAVTLQWIWYGGGVYYAQPEASFGEYYGCSDMIVSGGPSSDEKPKADFQGGDVTYPNSNVCKYWGSNKVGDCNFGDKKPNPIDGDLLSQSLEPCIRGPELKGAPYGFDSGSTPPESSSDASSDASSDSASDSTDATTGEYETSPDAPEVPENSDSETTDYVGIPEEPSKCITRY
ncbi:hypothetical protein H4R20_003480 [Coemansia guatemalensis]|uniref:Chitin-binding type-4 domain-containing protein n=1 Tax=Coemansia guatemalensis TaxID=2761395 RepID=A0A9W8HVJ1_9FUNG|nr:hypothetical protein H4R20_003480 [Coemansia guatemalensis]